MTPLRTLTATTLRQIDKALEKRKGLSEETLRVLGNSQATLKVSLAKFNKRNFCCPQGMRIPLKRDGGER